MTEAIDRTSLTPLLLRCFWNLNHNSNDYEYKNAAHDIFPNNEVQIYTWKDATLREISLLLKDVIPSIGHRPCTLNFCLVYPDKRGNHTMRPVGSVHSVRSGPDDEKSLASVRFQTGDYLDVGVMLK